MRISEARIYLVPCGGLRPVILELTTDAGVTGLGEACIAYGVGNAAAAEMIRELLERYITAGTDPFRVERLWSDMYDHGFWGKGGGAIFTAAMSAIEQAMVDIKARALGVPAYDLLGGLFHENIRTYCNGWYFGCTDDSQLPKAAEDAAADGYGALKFYPFVEILAEGRLRHPSHRAANDPDLITRSLGRVRDIRAAIGPDVELMLDLSAGLTIDDTIRFCREAEEYAITYIEEPTVPGDTAALAKVAAGIDQPVAVGERLYQRYAFRDVLESRAADILQPDIGNTGGILEAKKIAAMAEAYGIKVQPHICASPVSTAVGMHFSASVANLYYQEHFPYWHRIDGFVQILEDPLEETVADGNLPVRDAPGYGVSLRRAAVDNHVFAAMTF
jgi:galactonate dehydratase